MLRKTIVAVAVTLLAVAAVARAEDGSLRFEKTVAFQTGKLIELHAQVGPVKIAQVQFSTGSGGGQAGGVRNTIMAHVHGSDPDTTTSITAGFDSENPKDQEWVVTYSVEFLDASGKLIDRASRDESFEGEADVVKLEHSILSYVVPMISKVKIRLEAKMD